MYRNAAAPDPVLQCGKHDSKNATNRGVSNSIPLFPVGGLAHPSDSVAPAAHRMNGKEGTVGAADPPRRFNRPE